MSVFVAYGDVGSARHALARVTRTLRTAQRRVEIHPMLWRFNQLDDPRWQELALRDATRSHLVVLAMSEANACCARTDAWLRTLISHLPGGLQISVLVVIGGTETWSMTLKAPEQPIAAAIPLPSAAPREVFGSVASASPLPAYAA